jgi:uncharacterized protein YceH (UPF0502 family)
MNQTNPSPSPLPLQVQALLNRLQARFGSGLADAAATLLTAAEQAPGRVSQEWQLFWQEVELESERLARGEGAAAASPEAGAAELQQQIDSLRARVAAIAHKLDA